MTIKNIEYFKDLELVCKKHYKCKKYLYAYTYILTEINETYFKIIEPVENTEMKFDINILDHFKLPCCSTCHSLQGLTKMNP